MLLLNDGLGDDEAMLDVLGLEGERLRGSDSEGSNVHQSRHDNQRLALCRYRIASCRETKDDRRVAGSPYFADRQTDVQVVVVVYSLFAQPTLSVTQNAD